MNAATKAATVERQSTLHDHIRELRTRLFVVAIIFILTSAVAYNFKDLLIHLLLSPLGDQKLIYLNPGGGFGFIFQITIYVGIAATIPVLVYNLYRFVAPALPPKAQQHSFLVLIASLLLLSIGVTFGYIYAIPGALGFLNHFADGYVVPSLTADSYLNFILAYTAGLGILFQLPLILLFIHWVHPLKPLQLLKFERYMLLIAFVAAAIITPTPDIVNQLIIAAPIILMYQIGLIAVTVSVHNTKKRNRNQLKRERANQSTSKSLIAHLQPQPSVIPLVAPVAPSQSTTPPHTTHAPSINKPMPRRVSVDGFKPRSAPVKLPAVRLVRPVSVQVPERRYTMAPLRRMASIDGISIIS